MWTRSRECEIPARATRPSFSRASMQRQHARLSETTAIHFQREVRQHAMLLAVSYQPSRLNGTKSDSSLRLEITKQSLIYTSLCSQKVSDFDVGGFILSQTCHFVVETGSLVIFSFLLPFYVTLSEALLIDSKTA